MRRIISCGGPGEMGAVASEEGDSGIEQAHVATETTH